MAIARACVHLSVTAWRIIPRGAHSHLIIRPPDSLTEISHRTLLLSSIGISHDPWSLRQSFGTFSSLFTDSPFFSCPTFRVQQRAPTQKHFSGLQSRVCRHPVSLCTLFRQVLLPDTTKQLLSYKNIIRTHQPGLSLNPTAVSPYQLPTRRLASWNNSQFIHGAK